MASSPRCTSRTSGRRRPPSTTARSRRSPRAATAAPASASWPARPPGYAHTADLSEAGLLAAAEAASAAARAGGRRRQGRRPHPPHGPAGQPGRRSTPRRSRRPRKVELLLRADEAARAAGLVDRPGLGRLRRQPQAHPRRQLRRPAGRGRPGPHAVPRLGRGPGRRRHADRATRASATRSASSCSTCTTSRSWPSGPPSGPSPSSTPGRRRPGTPARRDQGRQRRRAVPRGVRSRAGGRPRRPRAPRCSGAGVGEQVASPLVTLVDDGTMAAEWGAITIDDEGHPAQRNVLIEDGVLTDYMWDFLRSRKEGRPQSGQRPAPELPAPADGADDQHLRAERRRGARRRSSRPPSTASTSPSSAAARSTPPPATSCSA